MDAAPISPTRATRTARAGHRPLQRRLTLMTMAAVAVTVFATCVSGWLALRVTLWDISAHGSVLIAHDLVAFADQDIASTGQLSDRVLGPGTTVVEAVRADGTVLRTPGEDVTIDIGDPELDAARQRTSSVRNTTASTGETYRLVTTPLQTPGWVLVVGRSLTPSYEILHVFGLVVLLAGAVGLGWAWWIGRTIATTALRPVHRFTATVRHIADTEDLDPVPADGHLTGEIATLTEAFNDMLARLATSRDQQDRLIADASHELRTPLTSMRTNLDLLVHDAQRHRLSDTDRTQMLHAVQAQTADFTTLIDQLVRLTREKTTQNHETLDLRDVADSAVGRVRRQAPGLHFDVMLDSLCLTGDRAALEQTVVNLLDNAIRWSPPGGTVHVRIEGHQLRIDDEGPGIAGADLPHIFDRFYRAETARSTPGTGLGLAIAAKTSHEHGGTLRAGRSTHGGAQLTLELPGAPDDKDQQTRGDCRKDDAGRSTADDHLVKVLDPVDRGR